MFRQAAICHIILPPSIHGPSSGKHGKHGKEDTDPLDSSSSFVPCRFDIERGIRISGLEQDAPERKGDARHRRQDGMFEPTHQAHGRHVRVVFKKGLVASLYAIKVVGSFVKARCRVQIGIRHIAVLARRHHFAAHVPGHDKRSLSTGDTKIQARSKGDPGVCIRRYSVGGCCVSHSNQESSSSKNTCTHHM